MADTDLDSDVDGSDLCNDSSVDERWRMVATYRSTHSNPKERFVRHQAGADGDGGSSYIDLVALVTDAGAQGEMARYSVYGGVPIGLPVGEGWGSRGFGRLVEWGEDLAGSSWGEDNREDAADSEPIEEGIRCCQAGHERRVCCEVTDILRIMSAVHANNALSARSAEVRHGPGVGVQNVNRRSRHKKSRFRTSSPRRLGLVCVQPCHAEAVDRRAADLGDARVDLFCNICLRDE